MNKQSTLYIPGHTGLIGSALLRHYQSKDYTSLLSKTHAQLDLTNQSHIDAFFKKDRPEYVILAAAKVGGIQPNIQYPFEFLNENVSIAQNVISASLKYNVRKLLYISCGCAYPTTAPYPIKEECLLTGLPEKTNEGFALAKILGIKLCQTINSEYKKNFISCIPANTYGVGDHFDDKRSHVIPALIKRFHNAKVDNLPEVMMWGTGKARREFIYVDDLAEALAYLMKHYNESEVINIGSGEEVSMGELAQLIKEVVGYSGTITYDTSKPDGMMNRILDTSKMDRIGYKPATSLKKGLQKTYTYYLDTLQTS